MPPNYLNQAQYDQYIATYGQAEATRHDIFLRGAPAGTPGGPPAAPPPPAPAISDPYAGAEWIPGPPAQGWAGPPVAATFPFEFFTRTETEFNSYAVERPRTSRVLGTAALHFDALRRAIVGGYRLNSVRSGSLRKGGFKWRI